MTQLTAPLPRARALSRRGTPVLPGSPARPDAGPAARRPARMSDQAGVRFAATEALLAVAALLTAAVALPLDDRLAVLGALVLGAALVLPWAASLGVALTAWAVWTGFAEHRFGRLTTAPADLERLGLLAVVATAGVLLHLLLREVAGRRG